MNTFNDGHQNKAIKSRIIDIVLCKVMLWNEVGMLKDKMSCLQHIHIQCHQGSLCILSKNLKYSIFSSHNLKSNNLNLNFVHKIEGTLNFITTL